MLRVLAGPTSLRRAVQIAVDHVNQRFELHAAAELEHARRARGAVAIGEVTAARHGDTCRRDAGAGIEALRLMETDRAAAADRGAAGDRALE